MTVLVSEKTLASPVEQMQFYEKEVIKVLGEKALKEIGLTDTPYIKRLVILLPKHVEKAQLNKLQSLLGELQATYLPSQWAIIIGQILELNFVPNEDKSINIDKLRTVYDQLQIDLQSSMEEMYGYTSKLKCEDAARNADLDLLKRLKNLNKGWNIDVLIEAHVWSKEPCDNPSMKDKYQAIIEWINKEEPTWQYP